MSSIDPTPKSTRRNFLKTGTLASAGLVLGAPSIVRATTFAAPSDTINVGFIGLGKQQEVLFHALQNIPGLRYAAICDIMRHRVGSAYSRIRNMTGLEPTRYTDAEEMLSKEKSLDAVIVTTPDFWHAPHTIMALEGGCAVYCEKMMSNTIEGARSMVQAMERTGKLCQIGHQRRSNPRYLFALHELLNRHRLCGQIVNASGQWNRAVSSSQDIHVHPRILPDKRTLERFGFGRQGKEMSLEQLQHRFLNWRNYVDLSGGPISDLGAHQIDIFNWFFDSAPKKLMASGGRDYFKDREHFDNVMCIMEYETPQGGVRAFYQVLTTTSAGGGYAESFMGTEGNLIISERTAYSKIYRESGSASSWDSYVQRGILRRSTAPAVVKNNSDSIAAYESAPAEAFELPGGLSKPPHQPHLENFFAAMRGKEKLNCDARHAFESEAPIFWINQAAASGQPITLTADHLNV